MALELERPCNLIVTLPGRSASERRYSAAVEGCFSEGLIPGLWGIGRQAEAAGIPFSDLGRSCDMIVASSVQEGFGYLFVEALQWGLPLFARDLDILEGIRKLFDPASAGFYNELKTPIIPREAQGLRERYRKKLLSLEEQLTDQFPRVALKRLGEEIGAIGADGYADFALFGVEDQIALLRRMESPGFVDEFAALNRRGTQAEREAPGKPSGGGTGRASRNPVQLPALCRSDDAHIRKLWQRTSPARGRIPGRDY